VQRRDDTGASVLCGIRYQRSGDGAFTRDLTSYDDWRAVLDTLNVNPAGGAAGSVDRVPGGDTPEHPVNGQRTARPAWAGLAWRRCRLPGAGRR
jgi:hypothetical protein